MDRHKVLRTSLLLVFILFLGAAAFSLTLRVTITDDDINHSVSSLDYMEESSEIHRVNATVRNTGSVGCRYTLESVYEYGNTTDRRFSGTEPLWPGGKSFFQVENVVTNYTGSVNTTVFANYCERKVELESFSLEQTEKIQVPDTTVEATTLSSNRSSALVELEQESGKLIPQEHPSAWKVSASKIEDGRARLSYDPEIFRKDENLTYLVLDDESTPVGRTRLSLVPEDSLFDKLRENILWILLAVSAIFNIFLLGKGELSAISPEQFKRAFT